MTATPTATVLITTRNRRDEARHAIESACAQSCRPEVLVIDDASTDDTATMVARDFPEVRVFRSEHPLGCVVQRNVGIGLARAPIVVSLDDDAVFGSAHTVARTLLDFDEPRVAAVAMPYVEPGCVRPPARGDGVYATSEFVGCAFAVRRETFLGLGGFREEIVHQGEERDFCLRLLATGAVVRAGRGDPVRHLPSAVRDHRRMDLYGRRNAILYAWWNEPFPAVLARMAEMTAVGLVTGVRAGRPLAAVRGLALGYAWCWRERARRRPVPPSVSRAFRLLWKKGPLRLSDVEGLLPAPSAGGPA